MAQNSGPKQWQVFDFFQILQSISKSNGQKMAETFPGHFNIQQLQSSPTESPGRSVAFPGFRSPSQLPGEAIPKGEAMTSWDL